MIGYRYNATTVKVVDGDTVDLMVDLGFKMYAKVRVRLCGINADEMNSSDPLLRESARAAKSRLEELLALNAPVILESRSLDKYGRSIGDVFLNDVSLSDMLLQEGLVKPYLY